MQVPKKKKRERCRFHPWVRKILCRRARQPTPAFLPGESHGQRSLVGCSPWGHKESDTTERLSMHTRRWQRGRDPRRKRRPGGLCCALSGAPELHLGSPLSPLSEPMPRCSSLPRSSSNRFSLGPVLTPSCPPQSPGLQPQEEEAGGLCASMIHPLRSQSVCQPASPTHSGLGLLPWGVASIKPWEQLWCLRKRKMVLPGPRKLRGIRIPGVRVLHLS